MMNQGTKKQEITAFVFVKLLKSIGLKKIIFMMLIAFMSLLIAGCGDSFEGDWMKMVNKNNYYILHISKADIGGYLLEVEHRVLFKNPTPKGFYPETDRKTTANLRTRHGEGILNTKEAFTWERPELSIFGRLEPRWNGTPLKLLQQYDYKEQKDNIIQQISKDALAVKDGKLIWQGTVYEKTDKSKMDKIFADLKSELKKQLGTEVEIILPGAAPVGIDDGRPKKCKGLITKIVIVSNGKEEVFEKDVALKDNNKDKDNTDAAPKSESPNATPAPVAPKENKGASSGSAAYPAITKSAYVNAYHSSADQEGNYVHSAKLTIDGNTGSCWSEGVKGLGVGENIEVHFNGNYKVSGMNIWIGHQKSQDLFYQNARPTALRVESSDGSSEIYNLEDKFGSQRVTFKTPITANKVKLIIERVAPGNKYEDTCISEVEFF